MTDFMTYCIEKAMMLVGNLLLAVALSIYMALLGNQLGNILWIDLIWILILLAVLLSGYWKWKRKQKETFEKLERLDRKYLIAEILEEPDQAEGRMYHQILKSACKSMADEIHAARETTAAYKEYIEEWIHEIKTPITAIDLICKNHETEETGRIREELRNVDGLVEQVLYYARSENVEKDYFIRELQLSDVVNPAVRSQRTAILEKGIRLIVEELPETVWTDEKWMTFILNQLLSNAVKYAGKKDPQISLRAEKTDGSVRLFVEDNGCGISEKDLPRVFEKGFTGGVRGNQKATGMGLYLSKKLCGRLGLSLDIDSVQGSYTRAVIGFPVGDYVDPARSPEKTLQNCK
ncbi:sensor histidine kinase [Qiania dongpingensis]|uniref:histidine kinase n=1 Tax=Qiania dongpingensis TaxID=2763669 RepID=A0A7G9G1Z0_9FIRM|nr:sensor histidine kinase [Qiania dongpingensis]QNM04822.1 sensor histidine kinase [Qiania dongpingensis]